jgi:serine/threonine protein kinase
MSTANCAAEDALIGSRIDGRYTLNRVLGQGGMGVVYEGVHDELGRPVAIKVLNAAWATDRTAVERFLREARTASSFSHHNIVDVSDLGRLTDGRPYLVMPKISGIDLATLLAENGPQPAKRVAALLSGVASALDLVHAKGFVHRDIKPENLMYVVREDGSETVMLLDFGIAAAVMSSGPRLTRQGAIFGTPHYLPPEVCTGERCDARGDVYSLAAVAFELITGSLPFGSEDIMQLMAQKVSYDAPSLATVTGTAFPAELEHVIATGLARDPRYRYPSASGFITALCGATNSAPVSWRTGVVRPNTRSAEHELPAAASGRPAWEVERAPTWPIDSQRPGSQETEEPNTSGLHSYPPARSGHPARPTPRYADESSSVQSSASFRGPGQEGRYPSEPSYPRHSGHSSQPSQPSYPRRSGHPSESSYPSGASGAMPAGRSATPRPSPAPLNATANPGVWANHKQPHTPFPPTREQLGTDGYDTRLRMHDNEPRFTTVTPPKKSSVLPIVFGACAFAALGMGAVQLIMAKRSSPQTDASASTLPSAPIVQPEAAAASMKPASAPQVARAPGVVASPAPAPTPAPTPTPPTPTIEMLPPPAAAIPSEPVVAPSAAPELQPVAAAAPAPLPETKPQEAKPAAPQAKPAARVERPRPANNFEQFEAPVPQPEAAAPEGSVLSVTPMEAEPPAAEPEPEVPAVDTAGAAQFAKQSSGALLRGELTKAIDLARRATQADPGYAIAWRSLGLALERAGSADQALAAYREYLQRAPSGPQAEMVRERMHSLAQ